MYIANTVKLEVGLGNSDYSKAAGETKDVEESNQVFSKIKDLRQQSNLQSR